MKTLQRHKLTSVFGRGSEHAILFVNRYFSADYAYEKYRPSVCTSLASLVDGRFL